MNGGWGHQKRPDRLGRMVAKITLSTTAMDIDDPLPSPRLVHHNDPTPVPRRSYAGPTPVHRSMRFPSASISDHGRCGRGLLGRTSAGRGRAMAYRTVQPWAMTSHPGRTLHPRDDPLQTACSLTRGVGCQSLPIPANPCQSRPTPLAHLAYLCPTAWPRPQCFARQVESTYNNLNFVLLRL
jgi:hypothetical protein